MKKLFYYIKFDSVMFFLSLLIIFSALTYKIYSLNYTGVIISILISLIVLIITEKKLKVNFEVNQNYCFDFPKPNNNFYKKNVYKLFRSNIFPFLQIILYLFSFYILYKFRTDETIISPWTVVPKYFWLVYFLLTYFLINFKDTEASKYFFKIITAVHLFLSFSVALIIYKVGFGFDPFIHKATIQLIADKGFVDPKPLYYLGQYGLEVILNKLFFIPIDILNKIFIPLLSALALPLFIGRFLNKWFSDKKINNLAFILLLTLPFSIFTISTPQNLSYLFLIISIFYGLTVKNRYELTILYSFALASLAIHPIAGIPAILYTFLITAYLSKGKFNKYYYAVIYFLTAISLPIAFALINHGFGALSFNLNIFTPINIIFQPFINPIQENFILNFIYLYIFNLPIIVLALIISGIVIFLRNKNLCSIFKINIFFSISVFISFILSSLLSFEYLIDYEKNNFILRIIYVLVISLFPVISLSFVKLSYYISNQNLAIKRILLFGIAILITTSLYNSYPRLDNYFNSHTNSTSKYDIEAVRWIEEDANNQDFIVLANQQVSAAALDQFGFKKYFQTVEGQSFYYPIPTGGQMYQYYLQMVYESANKKTMDTAMEFSGVNLGYFVLNKYWWASPKIANEAKMNSLSEKIFGNNEVIVFKFAK